MKLFKHKETTSQTNWLQILIIFLLGILVAVNVFLICDNLNLKKEISKLKADDLVLAQAVNNLLAEVFSNKTNPPAPLNPVNK